MRSRPQAGIRLLVALLTTGLLAGWGCDQRADNADKGSGTPEPPRSPVLIVTEPWPPYMGPDLPEQGLLVEVARRCLDMAGVQSEMRFAPWARSMHMVRDGEADLLLGAYYTEERARFLFYSDVLARNRSRLFARTGFEVRRWEHLDDLAPYVIGVVAGAAHAGGFDEATLRKEEVPDLEINIRKLLAGRVDLIAGPGAVVNHLLETRFPARAAEVVALEPDLGENAIHVGFSKAVAGNEALRDRFNAAFRALVASGEYRRMLERHRMTGSGIAE